MSYNIIKSNHDFCVCCMEEHNILTVEVQERTLFKNVEVIFKANYFYCERANEYYESDEMSMRNDIAMKNAYRQKMNLLTSDEICRIRAKYGVSQSDLCLILGWGEKTITRYESHQIQDNAHDTILRKIDNDPDWFITLLNENKGKLAESSYQKYLEIATRLFETSDIYLKKSINAKYARYSNELCGNTQLNIDKVIDAICYLSNSEEVINLFKVKLMKLLWYVDALSFKRHGHSMTGLVYRAQARGAVPVAHESIMQLSGICYEEIEFADSTGYKFIKNGNTEYPTLSDDDKDILDDVIQHFGCMSKDEIVECMHNEDAYIETALHDIIQYKYANSLSIN